MVSIHEPFIMYRLFDILYMIKGSTKQYAFCDELQKTIRNKLKEIGYEF